MDVGVYMLRHVGPWVIAFGITLLMATRIFTHSPAALAAVLVAYAIVAGAIAAAVCQVIFVLFRTAHRQLAVRQLLARSPWLLFCTGALAALGDSAADHAPLPDKRDAENHADHGIDARDHHQKAGAVVQKEDLIAEMGAEIPDRSRQRRQRQNCERHRLEPFGNQKMHDLGAQHENADDARRKNGNQQRAVVGQLLHRGFGAAFLHALHRDRECGGGDEHGSNRGGALAEAIADSEQTGGCDPEQVVDGEA